MRFGRNGLQDIGRGLEDLIVEAGATAIDLSKKGGT